MVNFLSAYLGYSKILEYMITPIALQLPYSKITYKAEPGSINFYFFLEDGYLWSVDGVRGTSIFMSHGLADKNYRQNESIHYFDYVVIHGPAWIEKMEKQGVSRDKLIIGGWPKLDMLYKHQYSPLKKKKIILWAPTHSNSISAYKKLNLSKLNNDFDIITSYHPWDRKDRYPTTEELIYADIIVSDTGSIVYEAWALGKQVVFPDWLLKDKIIVETPESFEAQIYEEQIGLHANSFKELVELVHYGIGKPLDKKTQTFIDGIFSPELRGRSGEVIAEKLLSLEEE